MEEDFFFETGLFWDRKSCCIARKGSAMDFNGALPVDR